MIKETGTVRRSEETSIWFGALTFLFLSLLSIGSSLYLTEAPIARPSIELAYP
jgi:hypothetical protein